jgi:hypothetical protein
MTDLDRVKKIREKLRKVFHDKKLTDNRFNKIRETNEISENPSKKKELSLDQIKQIKEDLKQLSKTQIINERLGEEDLEKRFKPVIKELEKVTTAVIEGQDKVTTAVKEGQEKLDNDIKALGSVTTPLAIEPKQSTYIGRIASLYLSKNRNESAFGIYFDDDGKPKIGKEYIQIQDNDIFLKGRWIKGTKGLWKLLQSPSNNPPNLNEYTQEDLDTYWKILVESEAIYQKNDKSTGRPKSSIGEKYKVLIKPLWIEIKYKNEQIVRPRSSSIGTIPHKRLNELRNIEQSSPEWDHGYTAPYSPLFTPKRGQGLLKYTDNPIEYKYIPNLNELLNRLYFIAAEENAGHNNFHNEKLGILKFFTNELEKYVDNTEMIISFISRLPKRIIGSGIVNKLIDNLPFELHIPGYNYCGPGTKLDKRLIRGDKGINPLDEACKEHDIAYKNNKDIESRHKADKQLELKAWDRFNDNNASIGEKTAAWATTNVMKGKRHLGLGLR